MVVGFSSHPRQSHSPRPLQPFPPTTRRRQGADPAAVVAEQQPAAAGRPGLQDALWQGAVEIDEDGVGFAVSLSLSLTNTFSLFLSPSPLIAGSRARPEAQARGQLGGGRGGAAGDARQLRRHVPAQGHEGPGHG